MDEPIYVTARCADLDVPIEGSVMVPCAACEQPCWLGPHSAVLYREGGGSVQCIQCVGPVVDSDSLGFVNPEPDAEQKVSFEKCSECSEPMWEGREHTCYEFVKLRRFGIIRHE